MNQKVKGFLASSDDRERAGGNGQVIDSPDCKKKKT